MDKGYNVIRAVLAADAYALCCHWVYDSEELVRIGRSMKLRGAYAEFHDRGAGAFTCYGDHMMHLLRYLVKEKTFHVNSYARSWVAFFSSYDGYKDHASKVAAERLAHDASAWQMTQQSSTIDFIAAIRFAPLLAFYSIDGDAEKKALEESRLSYNHSLIDMCLVAFITMLKNIFGGMHPLEAARLFVSKEQNTISQMLSEGLRSANLDTNEAVLKFGAACGIDAGLPIIGHLLVKYPDDPQHALEENLMAGGDTASRAIAYTLLQSAYFGMRSVREEWYTDLQMHDEIESSLCGLVE